MSLKHSIEEVGTIAVNVRVLVWCHFHRLKQTYSELFLDTHCNHARATSEIRPRTVCSLTSSHQDVHVVLLSPDSDHFQVHESVLSMF